MTNKNMLEDAFPHDKQIGGSHYKELPVNLIHLFLKINYHSFKDVLLNMFVDIYLRVHPYKI